MDFYILSFRRAVVGIFKVEKRMPSMRFLILIIP